MNARVHNAEVAPLVLQPVLKKMLIQEFFCMSQILPIMANHGYGKVMIRIVDTDMWC